MLAACWAKLTICAGLRTPKPTSPARFTSGGESAPLASGRSLDVTLPDVEDELVT